MKTKDATIGKLPSGAYEVVLWINNERANRFTTRSKKEASEKFTQFFKIANNI